LRRYGNPYDGIAFGQVSLWTNHYHHASNYGYYLEALMISGHVTGLDPRSLGENDAAAFELGMAQEQAGALQKVAAEQLLAAGTETRAVQLVTPRRSGASNNRGEELKSG
jgi:hypothetical protein